MLSLQVLAAVQTCCQRPVSASVSIILCSSSEGHYPWFWHFFFFFPIVCQKAWEPTPGDKEPEPDSSTWFRVYSFNQQCSAFLLWVLQSPPNPPPQLRYGGSEGLWRHVSPALENRGHSGCSPTGYNRASGQCSLSHFMSQYGSLKEDIATSLR